MVNHHRVPDYINAVNGECVHRKLSHVRGSPHYEYVEQGRRLLNRKQRAARVQASEVDRIQQAHRDLHLAVEDPTEISA